MWRAEAAYWLFAGSALAVLAFAVLSRSAKPWTRIPALLLATVMLVPAINSVPAYLAAPRDAAIRADDCQRGGLTISRDVGPENGNEPFRPLRHCAVEFAVNDGGARGSPNVPTAEACLRGSPTGARPNNCYTFATIEFDGDGRERDPAQRRMLLRHVSRLAALLHGMTTTAAAPATDGERRRGAEGNGHLGAPHRPIVRTRDEPGIYLIGYVHGWRHDARAGDADVRRLRVIASRAAHDLDERCLVAGRYCRTAVVALYLSWPARNGIFDAKSPERYFIENDSSETGERTPSGGARVLAAVASYLNALTFPAAKIAADRAGPGVVDVLASIRADVAAKTAVHSLLIGHSLGGDLILKGLLARKGSKPSTDFADLVVLLNPATETSAWHRYISGENPHPADETPPRLMFVAAPCSYWPAHMVDSFGREANLAVTSTCDKVVENYFRLSQKLVGTTPDGENPVDAQTGLGHFARYRSTRGSYGPAYYTHWINLNVGGGRNPPQGIRGTTPDYRDARQPGHACMVEPSFLYCARARGLDLLDAPSSCSTRSAGRTNWDFGNIDNSARTLGLIRTAITAKGALVQESVQIGTGAFQGAGQHPTPISAFWGIRSDQSSIVGHGGIASAPLLCMFDKLVLDRPAARPIPGCGPDAYALQYGVHMPSASHPAVAERLHAVAVSRPACLNEGTVATDLTSAGGGRAAGLTQR